MSKSPIYVRVLSANWSTNAPGNSSLSTTNCCGEKIKGCLIEQISDIPRNAYRECSKIAYKHIYKASDVLDIELAGNRIITVLLDKLIDAVLKPEKAYSQLLLNKVPGQYEMQSADTFTRIQAVIDYISGMTDVYALDLYRKINGMSLPAL